MADTLDEIEKFMNAISGQESSDNPFAVNGNSGAYGTFQIMPEYWPAWADEAGIGSSALATAENQYLVAKYKMQQLFSQYGNWSDVARAWYSGNFQQYTPEQLDMPINSNGNFDYNGTDPSINQYADEVMQRFKSTSASPTSTPSTSTLPADKKWYQNAWESVSSFLMKQLKIVIGMVLFIMGLFFLFKDNTMIMTKEGE